MRSDKLQLYILVRARCLMVEIKGRSVAPGQFRQDPESEEDLLAVLEDIKGGR